MIEKVGYLEMPANLTLIGKYEFLTYRKSGNFENTRKVYFMCEVQNNLG